MSTNASTHPLRPGSSDACGQRPRARKEVRKAAATPGCRYEREYVIELLNTALASELLCVRRYQRHHTRAAGIDARLAAAEFLEHATQEQAHADRLCARIRQLGGASGPSPARPASPGRIGYVEGEDLTQMIREDLIAERIAIESYGEMVRLIGSGDPTTRRVIETILAQEEGHADDLANLLASPDGETSAGCTSFAAQL